MTDRLRQIWSGFEQATDRSLTDSGVENIHVPHRSELRNAAEPVPADLSEPASAAFDALRARLAVRGRKARREDAAGAPLPDSALAAAAPNEAARDLVRGLKATEARLLRSERVYGDVALGGRGRRRKLFGLF